MSEIIANYWLVVRQGPADQRQQNAAVPLVFCTSELDSEQGREKLFHAVRTLDLTLLRDFGQVLPDRSWALLRWGF